MIFWHSFASRRIHYWMLACFFCRIWEAFRNSWHRWFRERESQGGWISVSVFINLGSVSPQPKGMKCFSAKSHQWAFSKSLAERGWGYNLQCYFSFLFSCVLLLQSSEKKEETLPAYCFKRAQSNENSSFEWGYHLQHDIFLFLFE